MAEEKIFNMYKSLNLWTNPICVKCRKAAISELSGPVGIWQLGRDFGNDPYKLVFIGKNARGTIYDKSTALDQLMRFGFIDGTDKADVWIKDKGWAYWRYTAGIIEEVFGSIPIGWEKVAFTNLVKCNNSLTLDNTTLETATSCLDNLKVTWNELEIIKPKNIIIFSDNSYDDFIERYTSKFRLFDVTDKKFRIDVGRKTILWWERHCIDDNGRKFRVLRTSHPERKKKVDFINKLAEWVKSSDA